MQWQLLCLSHSEIVIARSLSDWFCFSRSKSLHCRTLKSPYFSLPQIFKAPVFEGVNTSALFDATCTRIKTVEVSFKNFKSCTLFRSWLMFWFLLQAKSVTVTPLTVTVGYSDTLSETKTITNRFQAVRVTNMLLQWHFLVQNLVF